MAKQKKKLFALILSILFVFFIFVGAYLFRMLYEPYNIGEGLSSKEKEMLEATKPNKDKPMVVLITGVDERNGDKGRSDTLLVAFIDKKAKEVDVISIPRDSHVEIPGKGKDKINHAYAFGGLPLTIETVENFLGVPVNYYVKTNLEGFKDVVAVLGGIELNVDRKINAGGVELSPGYQLLNGEQALAYVRYRGDSKGDFGRMERQQNFLAAVFKKASQPSNLLKAPKLIPELNRAVQTNMSLTEMLKLTGVLKNNGSMNTHSLTGSPFNDKGISYVRIDEENKSKLIKKLYN